MHTPHVPFTRQARALELTEEEVRSRAQAVQAEALAAHELMAQVDDMDGDAQAK
jgi:hypothetical protein